MKCPKCNGNVEIMVDVTMIIPSELEGCLSKTNLRKKEVLLYAANWDRANYFCKNNQCNWRFPDKTKRERLVGYVETSNGAVKKI